MTPEFEAMRRRNQLALQLMNQNQVNPNNGPWSAVANLGQTLLGAYMARKFGDQEQAALTADREKQRQVLADVMAKSNAGDRQGAMGALSQMPGVDYGNLAATLATAEPKKRETVSVDGVPYYADTKEPVIPGAQKAGTFDIVQGVGPDGRMGFYRIPKQGNPGLIDGFSPVPKGGFEVTTPDGTRVSYGGTGPKVEKGNVKDWQADVGNAIVSLDRLEQISRDFKPEYLTIAGRIGDTINKGADMLGVSSPDQKKAIAERRRFTQNVNQEFNAYRKEITGAAAALAELEALKEAVIADDLTPAEFQSALDTYKAERARVVRIRNKLMRDGIPSAGMGKALDDAFTSGLDDDANARGADLERSGLNDDQVIMQLRREGYIR